MNYSPRRCLPLSFDPPQTSDRSRPSHVIFYSSAGPSRPHSPLRRGAHMQPFHGMILTEDPINPYTRSIPANQTPNGRDGLSKSSLINDHKSSTKRPSQSSSYISQYQAKDRSRHARQGHKLSVMGDQETFSAWHGSLVLSRRANEAGSAGLLWSPFAESSLTLEWTFGRKSLPRQLSNLIQGLFSTLRAREFSNSRR